MLIKKAKFKKVPELVSKLISNDVYGCDECKKEIEGGQSYLRPVIFYQGKEPYHAQICSWACFSKWVKKQKTDYFINPPYISYDEKTKGLTHQDFLKILK